MLLERVKNLGVVRGLRQRRYYRRFATVNSYAFPFYGVFHSVDEAEKAAPKTRPVGHDSYEMATQRVEEMSAMAPSDYPMVYWLAPLLTENSTVLDLGGHLGTKYRAFSKYLRYPRSLRWIICDLPAVVAEGRRLAQARGETQPEFTSELSDADGADVLMASGVLQFVEQSLWTLLSTLSVPPTHVLVNKVSCRDGETIVTLQNANAAFVPYQVFDWAGFLAGMESVGYRLVDEWLVLDRSCIVPFHPEVKARHVGAYFRRDSSGG